ncbi:hypothetical protein PY257_03665 [Ramlibacter sp. H39-3-26]|uniref:hypothetical protein n=1 Tax=Curvibacter soli TaxID=3031331 RepID=UPI0023DB7249|nr:hypothetical protein [Ramlibacter sp. H39-3-26]MDF1484282.1 hypothetical protein [Ramlibacter sp. H39-3-26]
MDDDNQILVPPSFTALFADARGRLRASAATVRERYELCEDLACHLVEQAGMLYHAQAPSEEEVLRRIHAGLRAPGAGVGPAEAAWIVLRLAELLQWPCPDVSPTP